MSKLEIELQEVMRRLALKHDVLPFMDRRFRPEEVALHILPDELGRLSGLRESDAGVGPVWLRLKGPEKGAELVVYRALCNERLYVVAPKSRAGIPPLPWQLKPGMRLRECPGGVAPVAEQVI